MIRIVRTGHLYDMDGLPIALNYHVTVDSDTTEADIAQFARNHTYQYDHKVSITVSVYTTRAAAQVKDYKALTGDEYVAYADSMPRCYIDGVFEAWPMRDDAYRLIKSGSSTIGDKPVVEIIEFIYEYRLQDEDDAEKLRVLHAYYKDREYASTQSEADSAEIQ